jgi:hypothetical protein
MTMTDSEAWVLGLVTGALHRLADEGLTMTIQHPLMEHGMYKDHVYVMVGNSRQVKITVKEVDDAEAQRVLPPEPQARS